MDKPESVSHRVNTWICLKGHCALLPLFSIRAEQLAGLRPPGLLWWRAQLRRRNEAIQTVTAPLALAEKAGLLGLLVAFCVLVWQGSQSGELLNLFHSLSSSGFSPLQELWTMASGMNAWIIVPGVASLGTLAFLAGFAIYLLKERS